MKLSLIVPVRNDRRTLQSLLTNLRRELTRPPSIQHLVEILIVAGEGCPEDILTPEDMRDFVARCPDCRIEMLTSTAGRGYQLDTGAQASLGACVWMLHADSRVPREAIDFLLEVQSSDWGRFDVRLDADSPGLAMIARAMNVRSKLTGICTGDQGIFVGRRLLCRVGGVPRLPLMEDVELSRRLRRLCRPLTPSLALITSSRRWQQRGLVRTMLSMWLFRLQYWAGVNPSVLAREYYPQPGVGEKRDG